MKTNLSKQWLLAALLLMAACGGSHRGGSDDLDEEEEEVEDGYQSPAEVDDDDWQTVSADGTTLVFETVTDMGYKTITHRVIFEKESGDIEYFGDD